MQIIEEKYKWNGDHIRRNKTDMIILHHAEASACTVQNIHQWHLSNGWSGIGYNYVIYKDGTIHTGRPEWAVGAHAANYNSRSIGICFVGKYDHEIMPEVQVKAGQELVSYLKKKYNITNIKKHSDVNTTSCPGKNFPFNKIISKAENLILTFQQAAAADGFRFSKFGIDGIWGNESEAIAQKCIIRRRYFNKYKNSTKLVQKLLGIKQDGICGPNTQNAIKKFQIENNLVADGEVGLLTWKKLLGIK